MRIARIGQARPDSRERGFTLMELMVTLIVFAVIATTVTLVLLNSVRNKQGTMHRIEAQQGARAALDLMARDIRSAGYGVDLDYSIPQPAIAYVDSVELVLCQNQLPFPDGASGPTAPLAYNPGSTPKPASLDGTGWDPPIRYRTGAELIRYTLDVNNDGYVDEDDLSSPQGADAAATPNPDDYLLVREVYGDSTGGVVGNNGGTQEGLALVRRPGAGVPAMFTVYLRGSSTPWDWANGPVPSGRLAEVQRIELNVTASAASPDGKGRYAQTTLHTEVNAMRSVPDFGATLYTVSGYVYADANQNSSKDTGESGLAGAQVRLGSNTAWSAANGYYQFRVPAGQYTLSHSAPQGYGPFTTPQQVPVTITDAAFTHSFGDTARRGGWVQVQVFNDLDQDGNWDVGEGAVSGIRIVMDPGSPGANSNITGSDGTTSLFTGVGGYSVTCDKPDTLVVTTTNPWTSSPTAPMTDGGTASVRFGVYRAVTGTVSGKVFLDANRNGVLDGSEVGLSNVWVGVSKDQGLTVAGYALTDGSGNYTITVPANDPPRTQAYSVYIVPPGGYFPTSAQAITGVWVASSPAVTGKNFGLANYQIITLTASRVLSLIAGDMMEADWQGNRTAEGRRDQDLILGADAGGTDNVSVWFNQYSASPLFTTTPSEAHGSGYTRMAPNSVLAMALDTLDKAAPSSRPDLVTGTKYTVAGNFFVWFNQNSNNNEGYLPTAYSASRNYKTLDNGDVQAVVMLDCAGGSGRDIVVGTKSPTSGQGTIEVWQSDDATTPTFTRVETYTMAGSSLLGEITGMVLTDLDADGDRDLVVTTRKSDYSGQVVIFEFRSKTTGSRFVVRRSNALSDYPNDAFTCLTSLDANGDGSNDIVVGSQRSTSTGRLFQLRNNEEWGFDLVRVVDAPGIVLSLAATDLGGSASRVDIACGYRTSSTGYGGGVRVYYMDNGTLPSSGSDPSNATVVNMVPALTSANFNYGLYTTVPPSPYLHDLAAGVKISSTTGALVVFIR